MAERRHIEGMIEKKEQEIQDLEDKIKEASVYLQALRDVLKKFPREGSSEELPTSSLRPGSMVAEARDLILLAGKPMHVDELLKAKGKPLTRDNRTALGGSLSAYVRKGTIFTRVAPNTFGLMELDTTASVKGAEPPAGFGVDKSSLDDDISDL